MKSIYTFFFCIILLFSFQTSYSQISKDTLIVNSNDFNFGLPIRDGNNVVYEFILNLDTNYKESEIYENMKATLSLISKNSGISVNTFPIFKVYSNDPLLFEDKNSNRFIYQLNFRTIKKNGEPDGIVNDLIYFLKADVRVKGNRIKITFKDIDLYFQSMGVAFLVGTQNSLFKVSFNGFNADMVGNVEGADAIIENGVYKTKNYMAKRIFTVDYKIRNVIIDYLIAEMEKNIRDSKF